MSPRKFTALAIVGAALAAAPRASAQDHGPAPAEAKPADGARPLRHGLDIQKRPAAGDPAHGGDPHAAGHASPAHGDEGDEHAEHGADAHHGPGAINWADFSNTKQPPYLALLLNFVILVGMYVHFGKKPVAAALAKRRTDIAKEIEDAQRIKAEAEARAKVYQAKLATLEKELAEARAALVEAGKGERDRIVREAEERAARMTKDAQQLLEQELKQMKQDLVRETVTVAVAAAEEILRASVTPADQERLAEELLRDLAKRAPGAAGGPS